MLARPEQIFLSISDLGDTRVLSSAEDFSRLDNGPYWIEGDKRKLFIYLVQAAGSELEFKEPPTGYTYKLQSRREDAIDDGTELLDVSLVKGKDDSGRHCLEGTLDLTDSVISTALDTPDVQAPNAEGFRLRNQLLQRAADDAEIVRINFLSVVRPNIDPA